MPTIEETSQGRQEIMVVDDNPDSLDLLVHILRQKGYGVRSFSRGGQALAAAIQNPPDMILLDVNMPEMDGFEVCRRLKSIDELSGTLVVFISARDETDDKVRGFRSGAVDYISKPFQFEEVHARIETHLKLRRAQRSEQELLEKTLNGATKMLASLIHTAAPELATRTHGIRSCITFINKQMGVNVIWQSELAATLCLIGCITLPEEIFHKAYSGEHLSAEETAMFRGHPETAAHLLVDIPRLEPVAEMIRLQQDPDANPSASPEVKRGASMLHLAVELDRKIYRGLLFRAALDELKGTPSRFDPAMLEVIDQYSPGFSEVHHQTLPVKQLSAGMTLEEDVVSKSKGMTILRKGTILNETWIERLENFARYQGVNEPLRVRVTGLGRFRSLWFES
jgi:CheY-like chemotaxis protein